MGRTIILMDLDGTLSMPRKHVTRDMLQFLADTRKNVTIGLVGGSDLVKQKEQLGQDLLDRFDYVFSENGLVSFRQGQALHRQSLVTYLGEETLQHFINAVLIYIANLKIPVKRGTFIEYRSGLVNVSPIGRNCSQTERDEFEKYDLQHGVRKKMIEYLKNAFKRHETLCKLTYSVGGQISFDVYPFGWDKTYCLSFLQADGFTDIHFFGDKTFEGGNDFEIYTSPLVHGYSVTSPADTMRQITMLLERL